MRLRRRSGRKLYRSDDQRNRRPNIRQRIVAEWLLERPEVADVFASDEEFDRDLIR